MILNDEAQLEDALTFGDEEVDDEEADKPEVDGEVGEQDEKNPADWGVGSDDDEDM